MIAGFAKCGSTSLYRWLGSDAGVFCPAVKEPNFFNDDAHYRRGLGWYTELFAAAAPGQLATEASVQYLDPRWADRSASRIAAAMPDVRLIVLLREPVARLRSLYAHEVAKARERRSLLDALGDPDNPYVAASCYLRCLQPYLDRFPSEQLCLVRMEDLVAEGSPGWAQVLVHLGLPAVPAPTKAFNVTADRPAHTPVMRWIVDHGLVRIAERAPAAMRRRARPLLIRGPAHSQGRLEASHAPIPDRLLTAVLDDRARLAEVLGISWDE